MTKIEKHPISTLSSQDLGADLFSKLNSNSSYNFSVENAVPVRLNEDPLLILDESEFLSQYNANSPNKKVPQP